MKFANIILIGKSRYSNLNKPVKAAQCMAPYRLRFMSVLLWPGVAENMAYTNYRHKS